MKRSISIAVMFVLFAGLSFAEAPQRETPQMRALRHQADAVRIKIIRQHTIENESSVERGEFVIRRLLHRQAFLDNHPEWVEYARNRQMAMRKRFAQRMQRAQGRNECDEAMRGQRKQQRLREKGVNTRHSRHGEEQERVDRETPAMKTERHERVSSRIARIEQTAASESMCADRAAFMIASITSTNAFLDANPEWTQYVPNAGFFRDRSGGYSRGNAKQGNRSGEGRPQKGQRGGRSGGR